MLRDDEPDHLLTPKDVAARWRVSPQTVRRQIDNRQLRAIYVGGLLRFSRAEVERYERERG